MAIGSLPVSVVGKKINGVFRRPDVVLIDWSVYQYSYVFGIPVGWVVANAFLLEDSSLVAAILTLDE